MFSNVLLSHMFICV